MSYTQVYKSPFGHHIVESVNGFYRRTSNVDWPIALHSFRARELEHAPLLAKLLRRATKRCEWTLYRCVKRAMQRRNPQPMPWTHTMFSGCKMPQEKD